ncbi:serine hydrolase domain-containing protein [Microbulbifer taiwanensis]|uniref:serine hydrolase domain-containing protein n=1 Tax=Microbulbifer taiwanensis TaxID=986746 RepID=UPI003624320A
MTKAHSPSGVVLVMKGDDIILAKGYGYRDLAKRIPVDPETTLFRPGSISKLFTWVSVMQLVEQGKLDLDADVNRYLKTFQVEDTWPGQPVTLRHIMTHTAGFEDGGYGYLIADDPARVVPLAESLARYQPQRVNPPGRHTAYSNWATALAGLVVANVSGTDFNTYVQQNIFDVLGMEHSTFAEPLPPALQANMAVGYHYVPDRYEAMGYEYISNFGPAGALASTAHDMARFGRALLNGGSYRDRSILKGKPCNRCWTKVLPTTSGCAPLASACSSATSAPTASTISATTGPPPSSCPISACRRRKTWCSFLPLAASTARDRYTRPS